LTRQPPWRAADKAALRLFLTPSAAQLFRRHPDRAGYYLFREVWPFGDVWEVAGNTDMSEAEVFFTPRDRVGLGDLLFHPWVAIGLVIWFLLDRRKWLRRHASRVSRDLWHRATPID